jgi:hypothetical protein
MGFSSLVDLIGSIVVGGLLFIILLRMNNLSTENTFAYNGELQVQQNLVATVKLIEADFRKIGYCADPDIVVPSRYITFADSTRISFYTDLATVGNHSGDGVPDLITYYTGPTSELAGTPNPYDIKLYRVENNETPKSANLGITEFKLRYYDSFGHTISTPVADPGIIQTIEINIRVENTAAYNKEYADTSHSQQYQTAFWRQLRINNRNLTKR